MRRKAFWSRITYHASRSSLSLRNRGAPVLRRRTLAEVQTVHDWGRLVEYFLRQLDRRQQGLKIERRDVFRGRHRYHLIVYQSEEALDRLKLRFHTLHRALHVVVGFHPLLKEFEIGLIKTPCIVVGCGSNGPLRLLNLILYRLAIDRPHMILAPPVCVEQIDVRLPVDVKRLDSLGYFYNPGEF